MNFLNLIVLEAKIVMENFCSNFFGICHKNQSIAIGAIGQSKTIAPLDLKSNYNFFLLFVTAYPLTSEKFILKNV